MTIRNLIQLLLLSGELDKQIIIFDEYSIPHEIEKVSFVQFEETSAVIHAKGIEE